MSSLLMILALLAFFLALGISRSVFDGGKGESAPKAGAGPGAPVPKRPLWLSWVLVAVGGVLLLVAYRLDT